MIRKSSLLLWLVMMAIGSACSSPPIRNSASPEWYSRMHRISALDLTLAPIMASPAQLKDPRYRTLVDSTLKSLVEAAAETASDPGAPVADPIIEFSAKKFTNEARQTYAAFRSDDARWTRLAFKRTGDQCVLCHTRADRGAKDFALAWTPDLSGLDLIDKIHFWLANRQYAKAMVGAKTLATSESYAAADPLRWLESIEKVMTAVVRVKGDDKFAEAITLTAIKNPAAPYFVKSDLNKWVQDIREWRAEKSALNEKQKYKLAEKLLSKKSPTFISYLRASALLHEVLENSNSPVYVEAMELAGIAAEGLNEFGLGQYYYEACIRTLPHSLPADRCYDRLAKSLRKNTALAPGLEDRGVLDSLDRLRSLAAPLEKVLPNHFEDP